MANDAHCHFLVPEKGRKIRGGAAFQESFASVAK
jgi:hypothetical protein